MSLTIENQIESLLAGQSIEQNGTDEADYSIENKSFGGKGIQSASNDSVPICQKTVTYIVVAVVINNQGEVLMMQEAKSTCNGKWYLPAGRVERNENLLDAVKREVMEETGLVLEPKTLILVECASASWFRFVFTGEIIGGSIKTLEQANEESLQASWVQNVGDLQLRSNDIVPLIDRARNYIVSKDVRQHPYLMPISKSLSKLLLRLTITSKSRTTNKLYVLTSDATPLSLPICEINANRSLLSTLHNFMMEIFGAGVAQHKPHGLLCVEFSGGQGGDGLCLTLLVSFKLPLEDVSPVGKYVWHELSENVGMGLTSRLPRNMTVPLHVVR